MLYPLDHSLVALAFLMDRFMILYKEKTGDRYYGKLQ